MGDKIWPRIRLKHALTIVNPITGKLTWADPMKEKRSPRSIIRQTSLHYNIIVRL